MQLRLAAAVMGLVLLVVFTFVVRPPREEPQVATSTAAEEDALPELLIAPPPEDLAMPGTVRRTDRLLQPAAGSTLRDGVAIPAAIVPVSPPEAGSAGRPMRTGKAVAIPLPRPVEAGSGIRRPPVAPPALSAPPAPPAARRIPEAGSAVGKKGRGTTVPRVAILDGRVQLMSRDDLSRPTTANSIAVSPDGQHLAVGDATGEVRLIDVAARSLTKSLKLEAGQLYELLFTPDGSLLVSGSGQQLTLFDAATGGIARRYKPANNLRFMTLLPDGEHIIAASDQGRIVRLSLNTGDVSEVGQHGSSITALAVSPGGRLVATGSQSGTIEIRQLDAAGPPRQLPANGSSPPCLAFSPDETFLATADSAGTRISVWELDPDQSPKLKRIMGTLQRPNGLHFGRQPDLLFVSSQTASSNICHINIRTGAVTKLTGRIPPSTVRDMAFASDGSTLAALCRDRSVHVVTFEPGTSTILGQATITAAQAR